MATRTDEARLIARIKELIEEYVNCRGAMDLQKVAVEIYELSREDHEIAKNIKAYWSEGASGAER